MLHYSRPGEDTPRSLIKDGNWWSVDVTGHTEEVKTLARFVLWSTQSPKKAADTVVEHLQKIIRPLNNSRSEPATEITVAAYLGIDTPQTDMLEVRSVEVLPDNESSLLIATVNPGFTQLREIQHGQ